MNVHKKRNRQKQERKEKNTMSNVWTVDTLDGYLSIGSVRSVLVAPKMYEQLLLRWIGPKKCVVPSSLTAVGQVIDAETQCLEFSMIMHYELGKKKNLKFEIKNIIDRLHIY